MKFLKYASLATIFFFFISAPLFSSINVSGRVSTINITLMPPSFSTPPVGGATVRFLGTEVTAETAADGSFTLENVPRNSFSGLKITKTGHRDTYTQVVGTGPVNITGEEFVLLTDSLYNSRIRGGSAPSHIAGSGYIIGVVEDNSGNPVGGAFVNATYLDTGTAAGTVRYFSALFSPDNSSSTNSSNGFFCIYNVQPGRPVIVRASKSGSHFSSSLAAAYPESLTLSAMLETEGVQTVSGSVFTIEGETRKPLSGVSLSVPGFGFSAVTGESGEFAIEGIPAGSSFVLKASKTGYVDYYLYRYPRDNDPLSVEAVMVTTDDFELMEDIIGEDNLPGRGVLCVRTRTQDVRAQVYGDSGALLTVSDYYLSEEGVPDPALPFTEPDSGGFIINLQPGYGYLSGYKEGFEFPVLWAPLVGDSITRSAVLEPGNPVAVLEKKAPMHGQVPSAGILNNAQDVPVLDFELAEVSGLENAVMESVSFTASGNISAALAGARLLYDSANTGVYDTEAGAVYAFTGNRINFSDIGVEVGDGLNNRWRLVFSFNGTASDGESFSAGLLKKRDIVSHGSVSGLDVTCLGEPVQGGHFTVVMPPPLKPSNVSPQNAAVGVLTALLQSSVFTENEGEQYPGSDVHAKTHWQVRHPEGNYDTGAIHDILSETDLEQFGFEPGEGATYFWRVRHKNQAGVWSEWSDETWFSVQTSAPSPFVPVNIFPENGAENVINPPVLESSAFQPAETTRGHAASQWQVRDAEGDYSSPVFDTGRSTGMLTEAAVPAGTLLYDTAYWWRVRHQDVTGAWSLWSDETYFITEETAPGDINGDGSIDISDVILCLRIAINLTVTIDGIPYSPPYNEWILSRANVKGYGEVNISDVILILRKAVGLND